jgi:uncharacterized protein (TIGR02300 family)
MPPKDLGNKHVCFKCGTKFYDMKKPAPICPKCGADQRDSPALKAPPPAERRVRASARPAPAPAETDEAETETDLEEDLEGDEDAEADDAADDADDS